MFHVGRIDDRPSRRISSLRLAYSANWTRNAMSGDDGIAPRENLPRPWKSSRYANVSSRFPRDLPCTSATKAARAFPLSCPWERERATVLHLSEKRSVYVHYYNALTCDQSYVPTSLYLITRRGIDKALPAYTGRFRFKRNYRFKGMEMTT